MLGILPCGGKMPRSLGRQCEVHSDRSSASPFFLSAVCGSIRRSSASHAQEMQTQNENSFSRQTPPSPESLRVAADELARLA